VASTCIKVMHSGELNSIIYKNISEKQAYYLVIGRQRETWIGFLLYNCDFPQFYLAAQPLLIARWRTEISVWECQARIWPLSCLKIKHPVSK
jgi:hypothetical protein